MELKRLDHVGVVVDDLLQGKAFLEGLGLECEIEFRLPGASHGAMFRIGGFGIALVQMEDPENNARRLNGEPAARIDHICFEVDNLQETIAQLDELGIETTGVPYGDGSGETSDAPLEFGKLSTVFTKPETSDGYMLQFLEAKGGIADALPPDAEPVLGREP